MKGSGHTTTFASTKLQPRNITMDTSVDFDRLLESIAKQHQQRTDIEVGIRQSEARMKNLESEWGKMKRKEEYLREQVPAVEQEIAQLNTAVASKSAELIKEKAASVNLANNAAALKKNVAQVQAEFIKEQADDTASFQNTVTAFEEIVQQLSFAI
jgi:chromosome segregation ATPase